MRAVCAHFLFCALAMGLVPGCGDDSQGTKALRRYEYRGIGGFSMGSMTAATLGMRHHEKFDIIAPLGTAMEVGLSKHFWINVVLTILGFIPGVIHALCIILTRR